MPDRWVENPRTIAAAGALQLYGFVAPEESRLLAVRVVEAIDVAARRGHNQLHATDEEVGRAQKQLARLGVTLTPEEVETVLDAALIRGWGS